MLTIEQQNATRGIALLRLGFRPFFLGAAVYAVLSVSGLLMIVVFDAEPTLAGLPPAIWHAHEMLFGYAMAVIAGFLLTAIRNWTGQQTIRGQGLLLMFTLWLLARMLSLSAAAIPLAVMAVFDLLFMLMLVAATAYPVLKVKQYAQLGIISKLVLLLFSNALFYLGATGLIEEGVRWGLYSGLYMILALLLVMARRVIPFFIEKGTISGVKVKNWKWVDSTSLVLLLLLWAVDVFTDHQVAASVIAAALFIVHVIRITGWYTNSLWNEPLLWVLYVAYAFIVSGFLLKASELWLTTVPLLYVHAFAYAGIGIMTIGMMSRVILGHTGRNVTTPPAVLTGCFALLVCGAVTRVLLPLLDMSHYVFWLAASQLLWIASFLVFLVVYTPMLLKPRIDGLDG
ncbi:MAG: NnrS family protein [Gammaproteobacteria bacterium]